VKINANALAGLNLVRNWKSATFCT